VEHGESLKGAGAIVSEKKAEEWRSGRSRSVILTHSQGIDAYIELTQRSRVKRGRPVLVIEATDGWMSWSVIYSGPEKWSCPQVVKLPA